MKEGESACPVSLGTITYHYDALIVLLGILLSAGSLWIVDCDAIDVYEWRYAGAVYLHSAPRILHE